MPNPSATHLQSLLDTLELLLAQARAYEMALSPADTQALTAVARLRELAEQACNEAGDLLSDKTSTEDHPFSQRQYEVLVLVSRGLTNKEIAYRLGLSERTIQFHLNEVFNKSGAFSRTEAVATAFRNGWLPAGLSDKG